MPNDPYNIFGVGMNPLMEETIKQESVLWRDDDGFRKVSTYFPFFITKIKAENWTSLYGDDEDLKLYRYVRVTTAAGFTFLVSKDTSLVVLSQAHNNHIGTIAFMSAFGVVIKTSAVMYSILSPNKLCQFLPNGINLHEAAPVHTPSYTLTETFSEYAYEIDIPDDDIQTFISQISKTVDNIKIDKTLADFQGLITLKDYDHTITQYAKAYKDCMFFVTKGPKRGVLLNVSGDKKGKWITGQPVFTANKPKTGVVYGDYEEPEEIGILALHKKSTSMCVVADHQGFFVGVKES